MGVIRLVCRATLGVTARVHLLILKSELRKWDQGNLQQLLHLISEHISISVSLYNRGRKTAQSE
jgi:hypothetical protein